VNEKFYPFLYILFAAILFSFILSTIGKEFYQGLYFTKYNECIYESRKYNKERLSNALKDADIRYSCMKIANGVKN